MNPILKLILPKPLLDDPEFVLQYEGLERDDQGAIFDPLSPTEWIQITTKDIVRGSLKIKPYHKKPTPTVLKAVAAYVKTREEIVEEQLTFETLTPQSFFQSIPPLYHTLGGRSSKAELQLLKWEVISHTTREIPIKGLKLKAHALEVLFVFKCLVRKNVEEVFDVTY